MRYIRDLTIKLLIIRLSYPQFKSASNQARAGGALRHSSQAHKDLVGAGEIYLLAVAWSSSCLGFRRYALIIDRKSLFSSIFGKLTKKTFARAYNQVRGIAYSGLGTPGLLLCPMVALAHWRDARPRLLQGRAPDLAMEGRRLREFPEARMLLNV